MVDVVSPAVPRLPDFPQEYTKQQQDAFSNVLRLYFNQLNNSISGMLSGAGGKYFRNPYGAFADYTDQTTTANTATLLNISTTDFSNEVTVSTSKIAVQNAGIYNLQFSVQVENTDVAPQDLYIWLRQNGVDIVGSTGRVGLPARKNPGDPFHDIKGWNYFLSMAANDYIEIYWSTTDANVSIQSYAVSASPTKPSTASVVATMSFVSALPIAVV